MHLTCGWSVLYFDILIANDRIFVTVEYYRYGGSPALVHNSSLVYFWFFGISSQPSLRSITILNFSKIFYFVRFAAFGPEPVRKTPIFLFSKSYFTLSFVNTFGFKKKKKLPKIIFEHH
jgi:hypothetical protein